MQDTAGRQKKTNKKSVANFVDSLIHKNIEYMLICMLLSHKHLNVPTKRNFLGTAWMWIYLQYMSKIYITPLNFTMNSLRRWKFLLLRGLVEIVFDTKLHSISHCSNSQLKSKLLTVGVIYTKTIKIIYALLLF